MATHTGEKAGALPDYVSKLPPPAQSAWRKAYKQAKATFTTDEGKARAVADKAVLRAGYKVNKQAATGEADPVGEFELRGQVAKYDDSQGLAFGWAYVAEKNGTRVQDHSGQDVGLAELEPAAYGFNLSTRRAGEMHVRKADGTDQVLGSLVESMVFTPEKCEKLGIPAGTVPYGWWIGFKVHDPELKASVKAGKYPMFSIGGKAKRRVQMAAPPGAAPNEPAGEPLQPGQATAPDQLTLALKAEVLDCEKWEGLGALAKAYLQLQGAAVHSEWMAKGWHGSHYEADVVKVVGTNPHGASIKCPDIYEALRREGKGKTAAAKISNGCHEDPNCNCH